MTAERTSTTVAAVDLGAASGRVLLGRVTSDSLVLQEVERFGNTPVRVHGTLHWDALQLYRGILDGLRAAGRTASAVDSVGVDTWGVDYGLLDSDGRLIGNPVHYRDERTRASMPRVLAAVSEAELYRTTGVQIQPFNTIFQLAAAAGSAELASARTLLLMPDLLCYWLSGSIGAELTNASTTQLLDAETGTWATRLMGRLGFPAHLFPDLRRPGETVGDLLSEVLVETGLSGPVPVTAVGSHDTASAVVSVPAVNDRFAYISCGTWSLVGVELVHRVITDDGQAANFTNEAGIDGTVRYLRNVMGLWLLQECLRTWERAGEPTDLATLLRAAAAVPALTRVIDPDDPAFLTPGDIPRRIGEACQRLGQPVPASPAETVRCILDSLALAHRRAIIDIQRLTGRDIDVIHLVGGGARNELLCQLTADACGLPVEAGPVEATAIGNVLVQARTLRVLPADPAGLRALVRRTQPIRRYVPSSGDHPWSSAAERLVSGGD